MAKTIAEMINTRIAELGISVAEAERLCGLEKDAIRNILREKSESPRGKTLTALTKGLKLPLATLAGLDQPGRTIVAKRAGSAMAAIAELDVRAGAGNGQIIESEEVIGQWQMPANLFRAQTSAPIGDLRVITIYGDSMEPELPAGSRVIVDTSDRIPSPPGIFAIWDGLGLVAKRIEHVPYSDPARIRLRSDNAHYEPYELTAGEVQIQGRVIGKWRWL